MAQTQAYRDAEAAKRTKGGGPVIRVRGWGNNDEAGGWRHIQRAEHRMHGVWKTY